MSCIFLSREICGQPSNQTEEEHVEGPQHGGGEEEAEREEEAGPQVANMAAPLWTGLPWKVAENRLYFWSTLVVNK